MKHLILTTLILLFVAHSESVAKTMYMYKYINHDGSYTTLVADHNSITANNSLDNAMVKSFFSLKFDVGLVPEKYYSMKKTYNIMLLGTNVTQYEIIPLDYNRFARIVWVADNGKIIRNETTNHDGVVVIEYGRITEGAQPPQGEKLTTQTPARAKQQFYAGYYHTFTNVVIDGSIHLGFTDGVNNFSVFLNPFIGNKEDKEMKRVLYGNYLYSRYHNGVEYTILGAAPHETMSNIADIFIEHRAAIVKAIEADDHITEALYNKALIEFDGGK